MVIEWIEYLGTVSFSLSASNAEWAWSEQMNQPLEALKIGSAHYEGETGGSAGLTLR
jgi:hypothetical protein